MKINDMGMTCNDIICALGTLAPPVLAEPWDWVGLQIGDPRQPVSAVMLAVDATLGVILQAAEAGAQMVVAHHPLIFAPLERINAGDPVSDIVIALIRHEMAFYAAHTNLDNAPQGTAAALAAALGLDNPVMLPAVVAGVGRPEGESFSAARIGRLPKPCTAAEFAAFVAAKLDAPAVRLLGDAEAAVEIVAAIPGAGGDGLAAAVAGGAQVLVTGELKST